MLTSATLCPFSPRAHFPTALVANEPACLHANLRLGCFGSLVGYSLFTSDKTRQLAFISALSLFFQDFDVYHALCSTHSYFHVDRNEQTGFSLHLWLFKFTFNINTLNTLDLIILTDTIFLYVELIWTRRNYRMKLDNQGNSWKWRTQFEKSYMNYFTFLCFTFW